MKTTEHLDEVLGGAENQADGPQSVLVRSSRKERPATAGEMEAFDAAVAKWYGFATERMRELGFESTDEFMKAIRGR